MHCVILGSGPCGLYAARVLARQGYQVTVLDKGVRPGGLATSHRFGNNWYDTGVHMLHAYDQEIFEDMKEIMGEERVEVDLNAKIKWAGGTYRYPLQFQDMIKGIPFFKLMRQVFALFGTQFKNYLKPVVPENAEDALIQLYGKPLYKFFFEDFTHRYWDLHPRDLSATFITTKMPKLTAVDVLKKGLEKIGIKQRAKSIESALTHETLHYSRNGAEAMPRRIASAVQAMGGTIIQEATVKTVVTRNHQVTQVQYEHQGKMHEIACDACISTLPITDLMHAMIPECPAPVKKAASVLRYKPIVVYGLLVKKQKCMDGLYIYYRDRIFHRVGEPKNAGLQVTPSDHTVLIVEMTCEIGDAKWSGDHAIQEKMFKDLAAEGLCQRDDIVEIHRYHYETGYPIFSLGFESDLATIQNYIKTFTNLQSTGRQGAFTYPNMHKAMRMGWEAANAVMAQFPMARTHASQPVQACAVEVST